MTVRGKPGKPTPGFPPFPPPLEIAAAIPTFPQLRRRFLYIGEAKTASPQNQQLRVGQIKVPKWADFSCQTHLASANSLRPLDEAQGTTLDDFSKILFAILGRPVFDKTGIAGRFDIRIEFSREGTRFSPLRPAEGADGSSPASDATGSIFAALQEALGLKLEPGKGPVEAFVIDHIEKPPVN